MPCRRLVFASRRPGRGRVASRRLASRRRSPGRALHPSVLGRPGPGSRAWAAGLRHHRGLAHVAVGTPKRARRSGRPGARAPRRSTDRGQVAPTTSQIGIVPVATTTHTEPFHLSKAIATLDYVSAGRAGVQVRTSRSRLEAEQFGRRVVPDLEIRAENRRPRCPAVDRRALRRGRRLYRSAAAPLGQLGGRRRDP